MSVDPPAIDHEARAEKLASSGLTLLPPPHPPFVIDTSVALKWYIPEDGTSEAVRYMGPGINRHAPDLLPLEGSHALLKRSRGQNPDLTKDEARQVAVALRDLAPIQ